MFFVWSWWYVVCLVLVAGIVAGVVVLFKMNKQDTALIEDFQKANSVEETKQAEVVCPSCGAVLNGDNCPKCGGELK